MSSIFTQQQSPRTPEHLNQLTQKIYHQIYQLVGACPLRMFPHNINLQSCQESAHKKKLSEITKLISVLLMVMESSATLLLFLQLMA